MIQIPDALYPVLVKELNKKIMKILILSHLKVTEKEDGSTESKRLYFHPRIRGDKNIYKKEGLLDLVNKKTTRYFRDYNVTDDTEGTSAEPTSDPLEVNQAFLWGRSTFMFLYPDTLVLLIDGTGCGILQRFVDSLESEDKREEESNNFTTLIDWKVIPMYPMGINLKKENLINFSDFMSLKGELSPENVWLNPHTIIEFIVGGVTFYVKGQSISYDTDDEDAREFMGFGVKSKIIEYIKSHNSEMVPKQEQQQE